MTQRIGAALLEGSVSVGLAASMRRDMTMEAAHLHYFLLRVITTEKEIVHDHLDTDDRGDDDYHRVE